MKTIRIATLTLAGLLGALTANAADAAEGGPSCRQETKRVAVWPRTAPKAPSMTRFEERQVTVCAPKAAAQPSADAPLQAKDSGN